MISTISDEPANEAETAVYNQLIDTANMVVTLSRTLAQNRIFPAIDIKSTYADREEYLLSENEVKAAAKLRGELSSEEIIGLFKQTSDNGEIIFRYKN